MLLAVKSQQTAAALDDLAAHAPPTPRWSRVQNGVANEQAVLRRFARTYAVCVMLPSAHLEPGVVAQKCSPMPGILDIGRIPRGTDDLDERDRRATCAAPASSRSRGPTSWRGSTASSILNLGNGVDAVCAPGAEADELARRARAEGELVLRPAGIDRRRARGGRRAARRHSCGPPTGTWRGRRLDVAERAARRRGSVEIDYLAGEIVLLGRLHGVPTPVNELVQQVVSGARPQRGASRAAWTPPSCSPGCA